MGFFERYLSLWVGLCIVAGVVLGNAAPGLFQVFAGLEVARVNLPVAVNSALPIIKVNISFYFSNKPNLLSWFEG